MLGLALANLLFSAEPPPAHPGAGPQRDDAGVHRGTGWHATDAVPEPPFALALVIVAAAGMRARDRRMQRRAG